MKESLYATAKKICMFGVVFGGVAFAPKKVSLSLQHQYLQHQCPCPENHRGTEKLAAIYAKKKQEVREVNVYFVFKNQSQRNRNTAKGAIKNQNKNTHF